MTTTETKAPLPDAAKRAKRDWEPLRCHTIDAAHELVDAQYELADWAATHADTLLAHIAALEADNKRLREALFFVSGEILGGRFNAAQESLNTALAQTDGKDGE